MTVKLTHVCDLAIADRVDLKQSIPTFSSGSSSSATSGFSVSADEVDGSSNDKSSGFSVSADEVDCSSNDKSLGFSVSADEAESPNCNKRSKNSSLLFMKEKIIIAIVWMLSLQPWNGNVPQIV